MDKLLTIAEMAKRLDLPDSTARYYVKKFADYMPSRGEGRQRRYEPEALDALRLIAEGFNHNLTATEVKERLSAEFTAFLDIEGVSQSITTTTQQQPMIDLFKEDIESRRELTAAIYQLVDQIKQQNERRPWWKRFLNREG